MTSAISIEIKGLKELQRKTEQMVQDLHGAPMLDAMRDSTLLVERKARQNAPVDTGRLRASILPEIRATSDEVLGVVGSNVAYAPYMELGTGIFAGRQRHRPPGGALELWASRHGGGSGYAVAFAISKKGGLKPRRFLQRAFEDSEAAINRRFERAVTEVVEK